MCSGSRRQQHSACPHQRRQHRQSLTTAMQGRAALQLQTPCHPALSTPSNTTSSPQPQPAVQHRRHLKQAQMLVVTAQCCLQGHLQGQQPERPRRPHSRHWWGLHSRAHWQQQQRSPPPAQRTSRQQHHQQLHHQLQPLNTSASGPPASKARCPQAWPHCCLLQHRRRTVLLLLLQALRQLHNQQAHSPSSWPPLQQQQ